MSSTTIPGPRFARAEEPTTSRDEASHAAPAPLAPATADPAPLGLSAFALTTFLLSMVNAGLVAKGVEPVVFGVALAFGGVAQLLAGMWEFRAGNTFGATAFTAYGAFWLSFWALVQFYAEKIPAADLGHAVGLYLIAWGIFTAYMMVASMRTSQAVCATFIALTITFIVLGIGDAGGHENVTKAGGYIGLLTAAIAAYAAFAGVTKSTFGRDVLPNKSLAGR